jgi:hypothetical protein
MVTTVKIWDRDGRIWDDKEQEYRKTDWGDRIRPLEQVLESVTRRCNAYGYQKYVDAWPRTLPQPPVVRIVFEKDPMVELLYEYFPEEAALKIFTWAFGYPFTDDMPRLLPPNPDAFSGWTGLFSGDPALAWGDRFNRRWIDPPKPRWFHPGQEPRWGTGGSREPRPGKRKFPWDDIKF